MEKTAREILEMLRDRCQEKNDRSCLEYIDQTLSSLHELIKKEIDKEELFGIDILQRKRVLDQFHTALAKLFNQEG